MQIEPSAHPPPGLNEPLPTSDSTPGRHLPWLGLLFAGSGCAALIYEIVWFQLLQLVIGASGFSIGVLLGTFMGGMCLGSVGLSRFISREHHPLRVYALLESGIGLCGTVALIALPQVGRVYAAGLSQGLPGVALRAALCTAGLLPPTVLMGATLPAISRWLQSTPQEASRLGLLYGSNIAGALFGCLFSGFYLLRVHDLATATCVAVGFNAVVAVIAFRLAALSPYRPPPDGGPPSADEVPRSRLVFLTIGLSGFCALGAEVIWTRLLSLTLGATVYTFSLILAVFLMGLGLGSGAGSLVARAAKAPRVALGWCQLGLMGAIVWTAYQLFKSIPYWPINPFLSRSPWISFQVDLVRCTWAVLPAACLWGASFPLALASASDGGDPGRWVGRVYGANTVGAILGALGSSLLLISRMGTQHSQQLLVGLSGLAGFLMLVAGSQAESRVGSAESQTRGVSKIPTMAWSAALLVLTFLLVWSVPRLPWALVAYGRYLPTRTELGTVLYLGEGINASVAVTEMGDGVRNFHVSGKIEASSNPRDMRLQRMLGHLPSLIHPEPRSVLVVGCGAGVTAGSFVLYPEIEKIVICEIEPLIPQIVAHYFAQQNYDVLHDPRVQVIYDDARHFVLTTHERFDIITCDPIHPWVKGAACLYTKEYFELCKRHLRPGGILTQWVPLYESNRAVVKSELATFLQVFPNGTIWSNDEDGQGYDLVLLGQAEPTAIDVDQMQQRLKRPDYSDVAQSLREIGCQSVIGLLATYAGRGSDLGSWLERAQINRDGNLRLQYLAGMGLNSVEEDALYSELLLARQFPEELFLGSEQRRKALRLIIERQKKTK